MTRASFPGIQYEIRNTLRHVFAVQLFATNRKAFSEIRKASSNRMFSSEDVEGFFQRSLALYVCKFPKNGAASNSLTDVPELSSGLPTLCLGRSSGAALSLPELCLLQGSSAMDEVVPQMRVISKTHSLQLC